MKKIWVMDDDIAFREIFQDSARERELEGHRCVCCVCGGLILDGICYTTNDKSKNWHLTCDEMRIP